MLGQSLHDLNKDLPCINKQYNIYAHAVYDSLRTTASEGNVQSAINNANKMFAPICISFKLCEMDTVFNYNYNILVPGAELSEISTLYVGQNRINLYIISDTLLNENVGGLCAGNVGGINNGNIYLKSIGSLTHELGHFFGLAHTFAIGDELVDGSNCETAGDRICDTPADPYVPFEEKEDYILDCIFISLKQDANGQFYQPDVGNIMSYYKCNCGFTRGQYLRMANNYFNAVKKHW